MTRQTLKHGTLAGLAGGIALAAVLYLLGEAPLGRAVAAEAASGAGTAAPLFGRGAQQAGGGLAAVLYGAALGAVFAVVFAAVRPRLRITGDWKSSMALAGVGLVTVFVVPFLHFPPNPPTVGDPETIGRRTLLFVAALGWSVVATWATWRLWRALEGRSPALDVSRRAPVTAVAYVALVAFGLALLPSTSEVIELPAGLIWQFRLASLGGAVALWTVLGCTFGWLAAGGPAGGDPVRPRPGGGRRSVA